MTEWHEKLPAKIGVRLCGLALLTSAWSEGLWLRRLVLESGGADATAPQLLLAGVMFLSASVGMALTIVGTGLWEKVTISSRWATSVPIPVSRDMEPSLFAMTADRRDIPQQQGREKSHDGEGSPVRYPDLSSQGRR
ncbi:hypothetical protein LWE61_10250 [Sphingobium sufflavum]|uniref:hypothetical protein n=1 Tax=Sphingobium sufflavum TaxID=1129547 RepID=UPI001F1EA363|nr:hypothetical protein [Sphingobium sufflavum]MCE7796938.1 hypothetical protein [Sphingobium sufflavum]